MLEEAVLYERVAPDDPNACQGVNPRSGPCIFRAIEGQRFCKIHFGIGNKNLEHEKARNYRLNVYQRRVNEFADNDQVKSLREELGILRLLLEGIVNQCKSETDLLIHSNRIADLVMKVDKVVASCHRLEQATGSLLDRSAVLQLGDIIINIVAQVVPPEKMQSVTSQILNSIMSTDGTQAIQGNGQ